jgi:hypothetical protein
MMYFITCVHDSTDMHSSTQHPLTPRMYFGHSTKWPGKCFLKLFLFYFIYREVLSWVYDAISLWGWIHIRVDEWFDPAQPLAFLVGRVILPVLRKTEMKFSWVYVFYFHDFRELLKIARKLQLQYIFNRVFYSKHKSLIFKMAAWRPQNRSNRENQKKLWAYCPKVSSHQVSLK